VTLTLDELEAIRLADLDGLYHEKASQRMNISRQTFGNILASAHRKMADFIINTGYLNIEGGSVQMNERCLVCSNRTPGSAESPRKERTNPCLKCGNTEIPDPENRRDRVKRHAFTGKNTS
jgi:uncharacterized protein